MLNGQSGFISAMHYQHPLYQQQHTYVSAVHGQLREPSRGAVGGVGTATTLAGGSGSHHPTGAVHAAANNDILLSSPSSALASNALFNQFHAHQTPHHHHHREAGVSTAAVGIGGGGTSSSSSPFLDSSVIVGCGAGAGACVGRSTSTFARPSFPLRRAPTAVTCSSPVAGGLLGHSNSSPRPHQHQHQEVQQRRTLAAPSTDLPAHYLNTNSLHHSPSSFLLRPASLRMAQQYAQQQQQHQQQQDEDLARLQELSNKWEPEATGPLVSELLDINAIITEYADADPIYQAKTAGLPQTFSNYRSCRGDGHCGWRAVAFCYFETLIRIGDIYKFQEEVIRLKSLRNILHDAGFDETIYEDFAGDTYELLEMVSTAPDPAAVVLNAFNDMNQSMSIITYLKLLTSAWMQKHPESYQDYLQEPVHSYCHSRIEPAVCEIEEVGLSALIAVLIRPAGISAEVHYLDRSSGSNLSVYKYESPDARSLAHVFRLLYRPGHYDILYKATDVPTAQHNAQPTSQPNTQQNVFVALQHDSTDVTHQRTAYHPGPGMLEIPGMSFYNGPSTNWVQSFSQYDVTPSPISPAMPTPQVPVPPSYPTVPNMHAPDMFMQSTPMSQPATMSQSAMSNITLPHHPHPRVNSDGPFRRSAWELENLGVPPQYQMCTTAIFRNSHYNTAHFNNPDFEPEQWQPDSDYASSERPRKKSSHSS